MGFQGSRLVFHGSRSVLWFLIFQVGFSWFLVGFMVIQGSRSVFHDSRLVFMGFHGSRLVFHVSRLVFHGSR